MSLLREPLRGRSLTLIATKVFWLLLELWMGELLWFKRPGEDELAMRGIRNLVMQRLFTRH